MVEKRIMNYLVKIEWRNGVVVISLMEWKMSVDDEMVVGNCELGSS